MLLQTANVRCYLPVWRNTTSLTFYPPTVVSSFGKPQQNKLLFSLFHVLFLFLFFFFCCRGHGWRCFLLGTGVWDGDKSVFFVSFSGTSASLCLLNNELRLELQCSYHSPGPAQHLHPLLQQNRGHRVSYRLLWPAMYYKLLSSGYLCNAMHWCLWYNTRTVTSSHPVDRATSFILVF